MNKIVIHQPNLFPRLKVLSKICLCDQLVFYDNVQFVRNDWQNRTRIRFLKNPNSEFWINIPVIKVNGRNTLIQDVLIHSFDRNKIKRQFQFAYGSSIYWKEIEKYLHKVLLYKGKSLRNLCELSTSLILELLELNIKTINCSQLHTNMNTDKNYKLINICKALDGDNYICGTGGMSYLDSDIFIENGISVDFQKWNEQKIAEKYDFLNWKNISFIDFWARYGLDELKKFLKEVNL